MTATAATELEPSLSQGTTLGWIVSDTVTMTWRNLLSYVRNREGLFFSGVQPIMFVILFRYVFGGAINTGSVSYVNFLMPGIFVQTIGFGVVGTAIGLAEDRQKGAMERFRSLPMATGTALAGRTFADTVRNVGVIILLTVVGYAVGFRIGTNVFAFLAGCAILLLFGHAIQWGAAIIGLGAPDSETAQLMIFPILFPITFASSAFVPVADMPGWLQVFAANQPITIIVDASRALMVGGPTAEPVLKALAWSFGLLVVFMFGAIHKFKSME